MNTTAAILLGLAVVFVSAPLLLWWLHDKDRTAALLVAGVQALIPLTLTFLLLLLLWSYEVNDTSSTSIESGGAGVLGIFSLGAFVFARLIFASTSFLC